MQQRRHRHPSWKQLAAANDFNGMPPGGTVRAAAGTSGREPTLTEKFNAAAKKLHLAVVTSQPVTKQHIEALKKKMSQPRKVFDMNRLGSVNNGYNPKADRDLMYTLTALTTRLAKQKGLKERFALAANKGELKKSFNRSSRGMGM